MFLFNLGLFALFTVALAIMLDQNRTALALIASAAVPAQPPQLFGEPFDILITAKVDDRDAGQAIRRAKRLGYKEVLHMTDKAGSTYIVFQLCPSRSELMPHKSRAISDAAGGVGV